MIGASITGGVGLIFLVVGIVLVRKLQASRTWPHMGGTVTKTEIVQRTEQNTSNNMSTTTYEPRVEYEFQVDGRTFTGSRIGFASVSYGSPKRAQRVLDRFPTGGMVEVMYDPAEPANAVLECKNPVAWVMLIVGIVVLAVAAVLAFFGI